MIKTILCQTLILFCFLFISCGGGGGGSSYIPAVTGWAIGWSEDEDTGESSVKILKTANGGRLWHLQSIPEGCAGFRGNDISAVNNNVAWAALGGPDESNPTGSILRTDDGGITWHLQTLPDVMISRHIKNIKGMSASEAWAVSLRGDVLHTVDGGINWQSVPVHTEKSEPITMSLVNRMDVVENDIWIVDVLAGEQGVIHSADGGVIWRRETLPKIENEHSPLTVSVFNSLIAWVAVNSEGYLWWTADGGETWNKSNDTLEGTADYDDICASNAEIIWIACNGNISGGGFTARVKVTGGNFEANIFSNNPYMMEGVSPLSDDMAWAVGFAYPSFVPDGMPFSGIFFTRNGGVDWISQTMPDDAYDVNLWKVSFVGAKR
ncbi:MAG: hypothetical protein JW914_00180 [Syntrophaceae bacterium]|nr:hypothetical protein [Syntrophaceae bacterium]